MNEVETLYSKMKPEDIEMAKRLDHRAMLDELDFKMHDLILHRYCANTTPEIIGMVDATLVMIESSLSQGMELITNEFKKQE